PDSQKWPAWPGRRESRGCVPARACIAHRPHQSTHRSARADFGTCFPQRRLFPMDRRRFLTSAALSAAGYQRVLGANDRVRVGLIGCGGRGRYVGKFMAEAPNTQFVATADVYLPNAHAAREWAGGDAKAFQDFRHLL